MNAATHEKMLTEEPNVHSTATIRASTLGRYTEVGARTSIAETAFGDYSYIVHDSSIIYATIGKFCSIAAFTRINPGNHATWRAAQHHFTYRSRQFSLADQDDSEFFDWRRDHAVTIGHDVWIGHGAVIMPGVTIGSGAVVGSSAVVTKDVEPYTIVAGIAAKPIRRRFPENIAERLMALAWWDWPHEKLRETLPDFRALEIEAFLDKYEKTGV
jgi:phosphonate metabolism protein (transferase hexapeptide repeat family)